MEVTGSTESYFAKFQSAIGEKSAYVKYVRIYYCRISWIRYRALLAVKTRIKPSCSKIHRGTR
jgi:hypothetical protein